MTLGFLRLVVSSLVAFLIHTPRELWVEGSFPHWRFRLPVEALYS